MPFSIQLNQADWETLIEYARQGTLNADGSVMQTKALGLDAWIRMIEKANNLSRYVLWVQWQEQGAPLPPGTDFPDRWPPELRHLITLVTRPITRSDVDAVLATLARQPTNVLVTSDPAANVGWTELAVYFR